MIGYINRIQINPTKRDKDNFITKDECAVIALEIPLDDSIQKAKVMELFKLLQNESLRIHIEAEQVKIPETEVDEDIEKDPQLTLTDGVEAV